VEEGTHFIVTGAGGWLGRATLDWLDRELGEGVASRVHAFGAGKRVLPLRSGRVVFCDSLPEIASLPPRDYVLLHYAFLTKDRLEGMGLERFVAENSAIGEFVALQAKRLAVKGIFLPSSGAVYGAQAMAENPYGGLKLLDERRFRALGTALVIGRIFNLSGAFINKLEAYALGSIIRDIGAGGPVRLRSARPVWRSYIDAEDGVGLALSMLAAGKGDGEPFDMAGREVVEIGELAQRAVGILSPGTEIMRPPVSGEADRYVGDGSRMARYMEEAGMTEATLGAQIRVTAAYINSLPR